MRRVSLALAVVCSACMQPGASSSTPVATSQQELSNSLCPPSVPAALAPAADQALSRVLGAEGVQIYRCNLTATGAYAWVFESPDAILLATDEDGWDDEGDRRIVGHHYAGPTWEFKDRSSVVGARVAGATVDATAIPWLLLNVTAHDGAGRFSVITSIQRLQTTGGLAPATGCDATTAGAVARVPYTATYFMYRTRAGDNTARQCR